MLFIIGYYIYHSMNKEQPRIEQRQEPKTQQANKTNNNTKKHK